MIVKFRSKRNKQFYFRVVAGNGQTIAASEGYISRRNRDRGVKSLLANVRKGLPITDLETR